MNEFLNNGFPWCPIAVCLIAAYLVWGLSLGKSKRAPQRCPFVGEWEDRATDLARQLRECDLMWKRKVEELNKKHYDELKKKRR
jgi:hypothetical protein